MKNWNLQCSVLVLLLLALSSAAIDSCDPCGAQAGEEWLQAVEPRTWNFPRDHGAHPAYRTEWWYFTGNLSDDSDRQFGYQLTFFRFGVRGEGEIGGNPWQVRDLYMAHFTVTEVEEKIFLWLNGFPVQVPAWPVPEGTGWRFGFSTGLP